MKKAILTEGKHDVSFLSRIHERNISGKRYNTYLTETADITQTECLRSYLVDNRFDCIYKSEEGYSNVIKKLRSHSLMFTQFSIYILVDLDGKPVSDFFEHANTKFTEDYGNRLKIRRSGENNNDHMAIIDSTLEISGYDDRPIPVMAFYDSLEEVTGINYSDELSTKITKINSYLDSNPQIESDVCETIFD